MAATHRLVRGLLAGFAFVEILALDPRLPQPASDVKWLLTHWAAFAATAILMVGARIEKTHLRWPSRFGVLIPAFIALITVSCFVSPNRLYSLVTLTRSLALALLFIVAANVYTESKQVWRLIVVAGVGMAAAALYGIAQRLGWDPFPWNETIVQEYDFLQRAPATFGNPSFASHALALTIVLIGGYAWYRRTRWAPALLPLLAVHLWLTEARSAQLALVVGLVVAATVGLAAQRRHLSSVFALALPCLFLCALVAGLTFNYSCTGAILPNDHTLVLRYNSFATASSLACAHPWTGLGLGTYALVSPAHWTPFEQEWFNTTGKYSHHVHSEMLELSAECGLVAGGLLLALLITAIYYGTSFAGRTQCREQKIFGVTLAAFFAVFLVDSLFTFNLHVPVSGALLFLFLGILSGVSCEAPPLPTSPISRWRHALSLAAVIAAIAVALEVAAVGTTDYFAKLRLQQGRGLVASGRLRHGDAYLQVAQNLAPYNGDIAVGRAQVAMQTGSWETALVHLRRALRNNPNHMKALRLLPQVWFNLAHTGRPDKTAQYLDKALAACERYAERNPSSPEISELAGRVEYLRASRTTQGRPGSREHIDAMRASYQAAEAHFQEALDHGTERRGDIHRLLAQVRRGLGDIKGVEQALSMAVQEDPENVGAWRHFRSFADDYKRHEVLLDCLNWRVRCLDEQARGETREMSEAVAMRREVLRHHSERKTGTASDFAS